MYEYKFSHWQCSECGTVIRVKSHVEVKVCPVCGKASLQKAVKHTAKFQSNLSELTTLCNKMNTLMDEFAPLHKEYRRRMAYFVTNKQRGVIDDKQYAEIANLYKHLYGKFGEKGE